MNVFRNLFNSIPSRWLSLGYILKGDLKGKNGGLLYIPFFHRQVSRSAPEVDAEVKKTRRKGIRVGAKIMVDLDDSLKPKTPRGRSRKIKGSVDPLPTSSTTAPRTTKKRARVGSCFTLERVSRVSLMK